MQIFEHSTNDVIKQYVNVLDGYGQVLGNSYIPDAELRLDSFHPTHGAHRLRKEGHNQWLGNRPVVCGVVLNHNESSGSSSWGR